MLKSLVGIPELKEEFKLIHEKLGLFEERLEKQDAILFDLQARSEANKKIISELKAGAELILQETSSLASIKDRLNKEINGLIQTKENIKSKLLNDFEKRIKEEVDTLNRETVNYFELKRDIKEASEILKSIKNYAAKLDVVSKAIKAEDFKLTNYVEFIDKNTKEKDSLRKEIERLQTIIAKERRRR